MITKRLWERKGGNKRCILQDKASGKTPQSGGRFIEISFEEETEKARYLIQRDQCITLTIYISTRQQLLYDVS